MLSIGMLLKPLALLMLLDVGIRLLVLLVLLSINMLLKLRVWLGHC